MSKPYQPSLFRFLHGISALLAIAALISSLGVYNTYDGRFGRLPLPAIAGSIDIHGTFGLLFLLVLPLLAIYSFHFGAHKLIDGRSLPRLGQGSTPAGRYAWHRLANTLMLLAATIAVISGRKMQESWLPAGELDHLWYSLHLGAWVILAIALGLHLVLGFVAGGWPLLASAWQVTLRSGDHPRDWYQQIRKRFS